MIDAQLQREKSDLLWQVRSWFNRNGYLEVITPARVYSPALEENLMAIAAGNAWLRTSPEFALKKAISSGLHRIYEIASCFRAEEEGRHHSSEFTMLEWYRVGAGLWTFMDDVVSFLNHCASWAQVDLPEWQKISTADLLDPNLNPEQWFYRWVDEVEPNLPQACVIYNYPKWQAALARTNQNFAERFEVYWKGIELGNAFHEECSKKVLEHRWNNNNNSRINKNLVPHPIDQSFLIASAKMPRCSGIAIGLERLLLCLTNQNQIKAFQIPSGLEESAYASQR